MKERAREEERLARVAEASASKAEALTARMLGQDAEEVLVQPNPYTLHPTVETVLVCRVQDVGCRV